MKPGEPYWYVLTKKRICPSSLRPVSTRIEWPAAFLTLTILNLLYFVYTCVDFMERFLQPTLSSNL